MLRTVYLIAALGTLFVLLGFVACGFLHSLVWSQCARACFSTFIS